jgi:formylmethanofuran dehydrogenase subunit E
MPDSILFTVQKAEVHVSEFDLPGPTRAKARCALCGQVVRDKREVVTEGMTLCRPCAHGAYYKHVQEVNWPDMDWAPDEDCPLSPLGFQSHPAEIHTKRN